MDVHYVVSFHGILSTSEFWNCWFIFLLKKRLWFIWSSSFFFIHMCSIHYFLFENIYLLPSDLKDNLVRHTFFVHTFSQKCHVLRCCRYCSSTLWHSLNAAVETSGTQFIFPSCGWFPLTVCMPRWVFILEVQWLQEDIPWWDYSVSIFPELGSLLSADSIFLYFGKMYSGMLLSVYFKLYMFSYSEIPRMHTWV